MKRSIIVCLFLALTAMPASAAPGADLDTIFFANAQESLEAALKATLKARPADPAANAAFAEVQMKQGEWSAAREALAKAPQTTLEGALAHGDFAWYTGEYGEAHLHYEAAHALGADNAHARWGLAATALATGDAISARPWVEGLQKEQSSADTPLQACIWVLDARLKQAQAKGPLDKVHLGFEAKADLEKALALAPKNPQVLTAQGLLYLDGPPLVQSLDRAQETLQQALAEDPFSFAADAALIRAMVRARHPEKARVETVYFKAKFGSLPRAMAALKAAGG